VQQRKELAVGGPGPRTQTRHLHAALAALGVFLLLVLFGRSYLGVWESQYLNLLAPTGQDEIVKGVSLTRLALKQRDLVVLLGSSELNFQDEFHPVRLFASKPTGYNVFVIGSGYRQSIHNFLTLAAVDTEVRGKPLILFLSPSWFTPSLSERAYRKNFSLVQAYEFAFDSKLSPALNRKGAQRLLALGPPGTDDALLREALQNMSGTDLASQIRYRAVWPAGRAALALLRLRDEWDLVRYVQVKRLKPVPRNNLPAPPDWPALLTEADNQARQRTGSNQFGIHDDYYTKYVQPRLSELKGSAIGESWMSSSEFSDLALVLDALRELRATPVFISLPVMGGYYDFKGHSRADRQAYYAQVRTQIEQAGFPVVDFGGKEYEAGFMRDPWHPGWKGSVHIAAAIDDFLHGRVHNSDH